MTVIEFVKKNLPNYGERLAGSYRVHKDKTILQWHIDKFPEAWQYYNKRYDRED